MKMKSFLIFPVVFAFMPACSEAQIISSNTFQETGPVPVGGINQPILKVEIEVGALPVTLTNMNFNNNGTSNPPNDVGNAKFWHFNDTTNLDLTQATLLGTFNNPWGTNFSFLVTNNPSYSGLTSYSGLVAGQKNYFWVTYDLRPGCTVCNAIDGEFIFFMEGVNVYVPTVNSPSGYREIGGPCTTSLVDYPDAINVQVYPVPATDELFITLNQEQTTSIEIKLTDISGRSTVLYQGMPANDQFHFSMKDYSAGIYFIELLQDGKTNRVKIIIL